jgi:hypothetical protein
MIDLDEIRDKYRIGNYKEPEKNKLLLEDIQKK